MQKLHCQTSFLLHRSTITFQNLTWQASPISAQGNVHESKGTAHWLSAVVFFVVPLMSTLILRDKHWRNPNIDGRSPEVHTYHLPVACFDRDLAVKLCSNQVFKSLIDASIVSLEGFAACEETIGTFALRERGIREGWYQVEDLSSSDRKIVYPSLLQDLPILVAAGSKSDLIRFWFHDSDLDQRVGSRKRPISPKHAQFHSFFLCLLFGSDGYLSQGPTKHCLNFNFSTDTEYVSKATQILVLERSPDQFLALKERQSKRPCHEFSHFKFRNPRSAKPSVLDQPVTRSELFWLPPDFDHLHDILVLLEFLDVGNSNSNDT
ncbi:uncharacterized protein BDR25DRAFT_360091 [Lindgomyces ingoldianus]|uniref:Uncharacterized protein n=1 Tax=Lindgomyces ingoldianus TaxID=673940 RepID=A0ACB6QFX0_9PLEO|nr:uncharacterized protein BDR25DRAFT_360091 [Lindgomyces ingoldianus]KAF2465929.1 hypothetical protein BDR25DRAFT_360091 [Lindgomyces ingoldianus]